MSAAARDVIAGQGPTLSAAIEKPRRVRGPSKKTKAALAAEFDRGYNAGSNAPRDPWPGAIAAGVLAVVAFIAGAWLF